MKVLLINPPPYKIQEAYYDTPPYPRTGLAYLAGSLRATGIEVEVLDCKYDRINQENALKRIAKLQPNVIGFTGFTNEIMQSAALAKDVKKKYPHIRTVIGGVHASVLPERTLREFPDFDYAVIGEGEITIVDLVRALCDNQPTDSIPGVARIDAGDNYVYAGDRERVADLDTLSQPAWDLFAPAKEYILHTQRGCPFHCPFCVNPNGRKVRSESLDSVMRQITTLYTTGCRSILFGDEVFTLKRDRIIDFCNRMIKSGMHKNLKWWCVTHINSMDYELAVLMRQSGCYRVGLGLESGDEDRLKTINKGTTVEKILTVVSELKRARLPFEGYFILGQPNETAESAKALIDFAIKINPNYPVFGIMVPYPGTAIGRMAEEGEQGYRLIAKNWNDYNKQIGNAVDFRGVERRVLERMQLLGYVKVFLKNYRLLSFFKFCWQYRTNGIAVLKRILSHQQVNHAAKSRLSPSIGDKIPMMFQGRNK